MDNGRKKLDQDDILKIVKFLGIDIFQFRLVRIPMAVLFGALVVGIIAQTYLFLKIFEIFYFVTYATSYFGYFYIIVCIAAVPYFSANIEEFNRLCPRKYINSAGPEVENYLQTQANLYTIFNLVMLAISMFSGLLHILPDDDDKAIFFMFSLIDNFPVSWRNSLAWSYRFTWIISAYLMSAMPLVPLTYIIFRGKSQMLIVQSLLANINSGYESADANKLFYDEVYQAVIRNKLLFCIDLHSQLLKSGKNIGRKFRVFAVLFSLCGILLGISIIFFIVMYQEIMWDSYLRCVRVGSLCVGAVGIFVTIIHLGESAEDLGNGLVLTLTNMNWYYWSEKNKKLYLIFLQVSMQGYRIELSQNVAVNHELGQAIVKTIYSTVSVLSQIKDIKL